MMEDCPEDLLKKLCCTCLSDNRKLYLLCRVDDGVNNLYLLLSSDAEAYREGFYKDTASLFICWECEAIMRRISRFRRQACVAQKKLTAIAEGRTDAKFQTQCLSSLHSEHITTYQVVTTKEDNFVDCGLAKELRNEIDIDDVPLSELQNYDDTYRDDDEAQPNSVEDHTKDIKQNNIKVRKVNKKLKDKCFTVKKMTEEELIDYRKKRLSMAPFVNSKDKCESCLEAFNDVKEFEMHNECHEEKSGHIHCHICSIYVPASSFERHISSHYQKYSCQLCDFITHQRSEMLVHFVSSHSKKNTVWSKGQRIASQIKNPGSKPCRTRIMTDKRTPAGFKCPECDKYFDNKNLRYKHIRRYHSEGFSCSVCGKRYPFKDNLIKHERLHQGPLPREECPICHKMIRVDLVKTHARIHSARQTITCVACDKRYISRASYENHLKYSQAHASQDVLKYKCSMCDKGYRSKGELRDHVNYQHLGKTHHKCPVCGKALATRRCITRHVRRAHQHVQESARDKVCQQCGRTFRDKKGLREHEFIHTGERPLSCEICGSTFRQSASLYTHRKRVHKIYPQKKNVELVEVE